MLFALAGAAAITYGVLGLNNDTVKCGGDVLSPAIHV